MPEAEKPQTLVEMVSSFLDVLSDWFVKFADLIISMIGGL